MPGNASCDRLAARNEAAGPDRAAFGHTETCKAVSGSVAMTDVTAADGDDRCRPASARVLPVLFHGFHTRKAALSPVGLVRRWARRCAAQRVAAKTVSPGSVSERAIHIIIGPRGHSHLRKEMNVGCIAEAAAAASTAARGGGGFCAGFCTGQRSVTII